MTAHASPVPLSAAVHLLLGASLQARPVAYTSETWGQFRGETA
jgi:hypothetical protein